MYSTWHNYGYGICAGDIKTQDVTRLQALLELAPEVKSKIENRFSKKEIEEPSWDDYMEYDQDFCLGLATIIREVIEEADGIHLTACDDYDGRAYLLYQPAYPWNMGPTDRSLTEEKVAKLFQRYINILMDDPVDIGYHQVENGS